MQIAQTGLSSRYHPVGSSLPTGFSTAFPGTNNPFTAGGKVLTPPASWNNVRNTPGFGYSPNSSGSNDGIAILDPSQFNFLTSLQTVTGIMGNLGAGGAPENELLGRCHQDIAGNKVFTYEFDFSLNGVMSFMRWNGTVGTFFNVNLSGDFNRPGGGPWQHGDVCVATFYPFSVGVGQRITMHVNSTKIGDQVDDFRDIGGPTDPRALLFASGSYGWGHDAQDATNGALFGWQSIVVATS